MERTPNNPPLRRPKAKRLDRRSAIKLMGVASAGAALAPRTLNAASQTPEAAAQLRPLATGTVPRSLMSSELRTIERAVDRILPPTETPGAADAGVHWYLDDVAQFDPGLKDSLKRIAAALDERCRTHFGGDFVATTAEQQDAALAALLEGDEKERGLFARLKRETVSAYYSSEIGLIGDLAWVGHEFHASFPGGCNHPDPLVHPRPSVPRGGSKQ